MRISKIREVKTPARGTSYSAGIDFFVPEDVKPFILSPGDSCFIPSGIKVRVPEGYALVAFNKSGVAVKKSLHVGASVVDEDYQGEVHINLTNVGNYEQEINPGDKIVQFVLIPMMYAGVEVVPENKLFDRETERGQGGFGSTGTR